ncbi:AAA family ATPase [Lysinibacillus halotolerans]
MKQVKLLSLELTNFKGIKHFKLVANGSNIQVFGDNAAGKTTIFDGFVWVLFDKDSQNKKDFSIKTLTSDGQEIHNLEHTVEAVLSVDGVPTKFKKVYKEKWTKKRGSANKTFEGHCTDHFVDDVPINKKEYTSKVAEIVEEEIFKLLTSPTYFNEQVKWQERRNILLNIAGDVSDQEVIETKKDLAKLNDILSGKSIEDMKKIIASRKKNINDELEKILVRIDEIMKMTPEITVDVEELKSQVAQLESEIDGLKTQKLNVQNGAAVLEKRKQLQEIETQMADLKRNYESDSLEKVYKLQARVQECQGNLQIVQSRLTQNSNAIQIKERELNALKNKINELENKMANLRVKWSEINELKFEFEDKCECPTCKQALPVEQIEAVRKEALAQFNERNSTELALITEQGTALKAEKEELLKMHQNLNEDVFTLNTNNESIKHEIEQKQKELDKAKSQFENAENNVPDVTQTEEYKNLTNQKFAIQNEIEQLERSAYEVVSDIDKNIMDLTQKKQTVSAEIAKFANIESNKKRIAELEKQQEQLAEEYEKLEQQTFLIEEFIRTKVNMLNERINSKFKYARFKLFDMQINGGLAETCETLFNGVPYGSGLNNAAKINVGLDIINTLSKHYGLTAPIFIDNAEAVTKFIDTNSQLISLVVSEKDKQLRVETKEAI